VTRKITAGVARIKSGVQDVIRLGNLEARRDWGHAKDYVRAMHLMLQQDEPDDFVAASGQAHTVREFCELAFAEAGLDYQQYVVQDEQFYRPAEVESLIGDASKARAQLGWEPEFDFRGLVEDMVRNDLKEITNATAANTTTAMHAP
jgi:GDPmannose 4,6-dehydratase